MIKTSRRKLSPGKIYFSNFIESQELVHNFFLHFMVNVTKTEKQNFMECLNKIGFYVLKHTDRFFIRSNTT